MTEVESPFPISVEKIFVVSQGNGWIPKEGLEDGTIAQNLERDIEINTDVPYPLAQLVSQCMETLIDAGRREDVDGF